MNEDQAKAVVHAITGVPEAAREHALDVAWNLGLSLIRACRVLDGDTYGDISIDGLLAK